jgi:hypothetical protein
MESRYRQLRVHGGDPRKGLRLHIDDSGFLSGVGYFEYELIVVTSGQAEILIPLAVQRAGLCPYAKHVQRDTLCLFDCQCGRRRFENSVIARARASGHASPSCL